MLSFGYERDAGATMADMPFNWLRKERPVRNPATFLHYVTNFIRRLETMKNAMKKLMSLVLVAVLLVSAVPFQAAAASYDPITVIIYQQQADGSDLKAEASYPANADKVPLSDILATYGITAKDISGDGGNGREAGAWARQNADSKEYQKYVGDTVPAGGILKIRKVAIAAEPAPTDPPATEAPATKPTEPVVEPIQIVVKNGNSNNVIWEGEKTPANGEYATVENLLNYCFNSDWNNVYTYHHGWSNMQQANVSLTGKIYAGDTLSIMLNEKGTTSGGSSNNNNSSSKDDDELTDYTKFAYPVYLNIYTDTTVGTVKKTVNITDGIAADGKVTLKEVKSVVNYYYNSVDTDTGITFDGLYPAQGNWVLDYVADEKYDVIEGLYAAAANNYVYINVMIGNAKLASSSSSSNADSTNPKTGDEIYMAITGMAVTASALALCFYFSKKRAF